jgi:gamma-glutamylcyclotransferase (GGCT)/AIG2-like uncharacterized protein YtfP
MNTNLGEMAYRCPRAQNLGPALLNDHKLTFKQHADIEFCPGSQVEGVLWMITESCEMNLDALEGFPVYYEKSNFFVNNAQGHRVQAMAYQMTLTHGANRMSMPSPQYVQCLIEGYEDNGLNTDQIYRALEEFGDYVHEK